MSTWISLAEGIRLVESAFGPTGALNRLEHRIWESQIAIKMRLVELWDKNGRNAPADELSEIFFARLAIRGLARAETNPGFSVVEHADLNVGDLSVATGDALITVFGLRLCKEDIIWAFELSSEQSKPKPVTICEAEDFIRNRITENSKQSWQQFRATYGHTAVNREAYMDLWRQLTGNRPRGRPKKSPN